MENKNINFSEKLKSLHESIDNGILNGQNKDKLTILERASKSFGDLNGRIAKSLTDFSNDFKDFGLNLKSTIIELMNPKSVKPISENYKNKNKIGG